MKITLEFRQFKKKPVKVVIETDQIHTIAQLRPLWEMEQTLNNLPGTKTRVHVNVEE